MRKSLIGAVVAALCMIVALAPARAGAVYSVTCNSPCTTLTIDVENIRTMSDLLFVSLRFLPPATNIAGGVTATIETNGGNTTIASGINVLRSSGGTLVAIAGGDLTLNTMADLAYDGTEFVHQNPATGTDPVGTEKIFTGTAAEAPAGYLIENGACVSQTTYAALYASYGSTDTWSPGNGATCSGSQFHVKFANGRASVASNTQGSQTGPLTNCTAAVGSVCGVQTETIAQSALPNTALTVSTSVSTSVSTGVTIPAGQGSHNHGVSYTGNPLMENGAATYGWTQGTSDTQPVSTTDITTQAATLPAMAGSGSGTGSGSGYGVTSSMNGGVSQTGVTTVPPINSNIFLVKY